MARRRMNGFTLVNSAIVDQDHFRLRWNSVDDGDSKVVKIRSGDDRIIGRRRIDLGVIHDHAAAVVKVAGGRRAFFCFKIFLVRGLVLPP